jgi:ribosomal protein S18 acetylase RimI-like enzyme
MRLTVDGEWPGEVKLRSSWSKAIGRRWNSELPYAHVRLIRGSSAFLRAAADHLLGYDVELVTSPPLATGADGVWTRAGFGPFLELHLYRRNLMLPYEAPRQAVVEITPDFDELNTLDRTAFDPLWRVDPLGLKESHSATARSTVLSIQSDDGRLGYAIVGVAGVTGYLQRIAVDINARRQGVGRDLVRAAMSWAADHGAASMLLNTQPENTASAALYRSEDFARVPGNLRVLRYDR